MLVDRIKEEDIGVRDDPAKFNRIATVEVLKEKNKGFMAMGPNGKISIKLNQK